MARWGSFLFPKHGVSNFLTNRDDGQIENNKWFWMYRAVFRILQNCIKSASSQTGMNISSLNMTGSFLRSNVPFRQYLPWVLCNPRVHCYQTTYPEPVKFTPRLSTSFLWYILLLITRLPSGLFVSVYTTLILYALLIYSAGHLPAHFYVLVMITIVIRGTNLI
jgi:hypothetical protein